MDQQFYETVARHEEWLEDQAALAKITYDVYCQSIAHKTFYVGSVTADKKSEFINSTHYDANKLIFWKRSL